MTDKFMSLNVEFSNMNMSENRGSTNYQFESCKKNYSLGVREEFAKPNRPNSMSDVLRIQPTTLSDRNTLKVSDEPERPSRLNVVPCIVRCHTTLGDRRKKQDSLGFSDEPERPNKLNVVPRIVRSHTTLGYRRKKQDSSGISDELEKPTRLNVVPSIIRSHTTLGDTRVKHDTLKVSEELEKPNRLNVVPSIGRSHSTLGDRRKKQDSQRVTEELDKPNGLNLTPEVFRIELTCVSPRSKAQSALREIIVKNWILVKDNSSPFSWWKEFKERNFLSISAFKDLDKKTTNIERRDLAELLLIKALQTDVCTSEEKIAVLSKMILKGLENELIQSSREHVHIVSDDKKLHDYFKRNKKEWEKCLNRQEVIKIKDNLLQEEFITFEDNEKFVNADDYYKRSKDHLFSQIIEKVVKNKGAFQCFIRHAEDIIRQKQSGQKLLQKTRQPLNRMQPAERSVLINSKEESFAENDAHEGQPFEWSVKLTDEKGKEATEAYEHGRKNSHIVDVVCHKTLEATCDEISLGSIVIHCHPLDKGTCCTFKGQFVNSIHMLLQEVILKSKIPSGKYTLRAEVKVTHNLNKTVSEFKPLTDEINFVTAEQSFLVEEIDVDAVLEGFKTKNIAIESINQTGCRHNNARNLLNSIIKNHLEDDFIDILREYRMTYIINRYETYMHVYKSETNVLRRNIIKNFSTIMEYIDIDDIREVLLDRGVTKESTLNELVFKFENRRDFAMATLIIEFLKSGNAIHAFAYALFLQEYNPLQVNNTPQESQRISNTVEENELGFYQVEDSRQIYSGRFNITIQSEDARDGSVFYNKEKRSQFPISASYIANQYQLQDTRTHYDMTHPLNNRYTKALNGVPALPNLTRLNNGSQREVPSRLLNTGSINRARTATTNDVERCADEDRILSNNDELSEIALSSDSTTYTTGSGFFTGLEADNHIHRTHSSASTMYSKDSDDSIQLEADINSHRIISPAGTTGTPDSGYSTQLEADGYTHRVSLPDSPLGTKDSSYSTQLEAIGITYKNLSPASTLGTTDSVDSTKLKADVFTNSVRSPASTLGTKHTGYSTQHKADVYTSRIRSPDV